MTSRNPSGIKVHSLMYVRMSAPDLDQAQRFLVDFGFTPSARTSTALYMRGTDDAHHIHITELGEPRVIGVGFEVTDEAMLDIASKLDGASEMQPIDEPGKGKRVRLTDPLGNVVELVHGMEKVEQAPLEPTRINDGSGKRRRVGVPRRPARGPARIKSMGHAVIVTPDLETVASWYVDTLGLLCSDTILSEQGSDVLGGFYRVDRGDEYVDHHMLNVAMGPADGFNHFAYEVADIDDIMIGHEYLGEQGYRHMRGPGRHFVGSQVFDYWLDPWGRMHEHLTDTDMLNQQAEPGYYASGTTNSPWGESSSPAFKDQISC